MRLIGVLALALGVAWGLGAQFGRNPRAPEQDEARLPDGKSQKREILKSEYKKSREDAAELLALAQDLKEELDKVPYQVVDMRLVKKAEDIEKLARSIKNRMKRY